MTHYEVGDVFTLRPPTGETMDLAKCKIEFPQIGGGSYRRIMIDGIEWGTAGGSLEGRHGYRFVFKDVAQALVKTNPVRPLVAAPYRAVAKNKAGIDDALKQAVISMIDAGDLRNPVEVREAAALANSAKQKAIDAAKEAKRKLWEKQANHAVFPFAAYLGESNTVELVARIIEAMEWAQTQ